MNQIVDTAPIFSYGLVKKVVNLTLLPTILEVNIAFVSLADTDDFSRNGNLHPTLGVDASFLRRWLDGNDRSKTIGINAQMGGTLSMLQTNFIAKVMDQGIVTFANDSPEGGKYKFGGNIKIPVSGGDNGDLKDISYGYDVKVKGGLVSENQVRLDLDIRSQTVDTDTQGNYDQKENSATLTLPMNINDTYIVAHHKKATETSVQTGTPVLGRVPLLKYLFSSTATEKKVVNVLVLVSTTVQTLKGETIMPMETKKVIQDAKKDTGELLKESGANGYSKDFKNLSK